MPLISTLPKRVNPVTIDDFREVPSITFLPDSAKMHQKSVDYWNDWIDYSPQQIADIFSVQIQDGFEVFVVSPDKGKFIFCLSHNLYGTQEQRYNLNYNVVEYTDARMDEAIQGKRHGRDITMRFIDLDVALNVRRVLFSAELSVGGYAWARMGYELDNGDSNKRREIELLSDRLHWKMSAISSVLPEGLNKDVSNRILLINPDSLYHLTRIEDDLLPYFKVEDFEHSGFMYDALMANSPTNKKHTFELIAGMKAAVKFCQDNGRPLTYGKLGLAAEKWRAKVNYDNDVQMERILSYGGGSDLSYIANAQPPRDNHLCRLSA